VAEGVIGLASAVLAVALGQPELLIMSVMSFAAMTGVMSKATDGLADTFEALGMSDTAAKILSGVAVTVAVVAATFIFAPESSAEDIASEASSLAGGSDAAASGGEEASTLQQIQETLSSAGNKVRSFVKAVNLFNKLPVRANLMLMALAQSLSQTNVVTNAAVAMAPSKDKDEVKRRAALAMGIIAAIVSIGAGSAALEGATGAQGLNDTAFAKLFNGSKIEASTLMNIGSTLQRGGLYGSALASVYQGFTMVQQGLGEGKLGELQAGYQLLETAVKLSSSATTQDQQAMASTLKNQAISNRGISQLMQDGFAQLLTTGSPV
jgi:hypothetical protein